MFLRLPPPPPHTTPMSDEYHMVINNQLNSFYSIISSDKGAIWWRYTALQSQTAVTAYYSRTLLLSFIFAQKYRWPMEWEHAIWL